MAKKQKTQPKVEVEDTKLLATIAKLEKEHSSTELRGILRKSLNIGAKLPETTRKNRAFVAGLSDAQVLTHVACMTIDYTYRPKSAPKGIESKAAKKRHGITGKKRKYVAVADIKDVDNLGHRALRQHARRICGIFGEELDAMSDKQIRMKIKLSLRKAEKETKKAA